MANLPEAYKVPYVWMDGKLIDREASYVPVMALTLHYGLGAFEGIRSYQGEKASFVFRLEEHLKRLEESCRMMRMDLPYTVEELSAACIETLLANKLAEAYLRPIAFMDDGQRGLSANNNVRVAIVVWPWGSYLGDEGMKRGIRTMISGWTRMNSRSSMPKGKICGQYVNSIMAKRDALGAGYDEALMLDDDGYVAEGTGENIFVIKNGALYTPPLSSPILAGITRATLIAMAKDEGFSVMERRLTRSDLYLSDEIFLTGTAAEVTPVREVDGHSIGRGSRGEITERLQKLYLNSVRGKTEKYQGWCSEYKLG